jgi:hypothetical protein
MVDSVHLFIRSYPTPRNMELALFSRQHVACAPELLQHDSAGLQGRILDSDSASLLGLLGQLCPGSGVRLELHDVGRLRGWLRATWSGVRQTPAVVVDGHRHLGLAAARDALRALSASTSGGPPTKVGAAPAPRRA